LAGAGRLTMAGAVAGSVLGSAGNYTQGGSVAGSQRVNLDQPAEEPEPTLADRSLDALRRYVSLLLVGVLGLWLCPCWSGAPPRSPGAVPWSAWGSGSGVLAVLVALVLLVGVTVLVAVVLRLGSLTQVTVGELRAALPDADDLLAGLLRVAEATRTVLEVDGAGLTLVHEDGPPRWVAATDAAMELLEQIQQDFGEGPYLQATPRTRP
jgi:hypothetical protein